MYDHEGYEPFEPDVTPMSQAAAGRGLEPPPAPQRERQQMVAPPGPDPGHGLMVHKDRTRSLAERST